MLFSHDPIEMRRCFFVAWEKYQQGQILTDLEQQIVAVSLKHPEYHQILENPERYLSKTYSAMSDEANPFLHLGLHLAIQDQLQMKQPACLDNVFKQLCGKHSEHEAEHVLMQCLLEALSEAAESGNYDPDVYEKRLKNLLLNP
ncbi:MAG: DUF1841 family protein [Pseudomonadota bacterium]